MLIATIAIIAGLALLLRAYVAAPIQELRRTRGVLERLDDVINVKDFGAVGDGSSDDTKAIQDAVNHALNSFTWPNRPPVYFPTGTYLTDTIYGVSGSVPLLIGADVQHTRIQHISGSAAPLFSIPAAAPGGATPSGGFLNMSLQAGDSTTALAYFAGDVDHGLKFENVAFVGWATAPGSSCDGISIRDYVNLHIERVRFDYIGGWAVRIRGPLTYGLATMSMRDFTYDNGGTAFNNGLGVVKIDASDLNAYKGPVSISNARIEINAPLASDETVKSLFRVNANAFVDTGYSQIDWDFRCIVADVVASARSIAFVVSSLRDPSAHFIDCRTNVYQLADNDTNSMQRREGLNAGGTAGLINGTMQGLRYDGPGVSRFERVSGLRQFRVSSDANLTGQGALFERGDRALCSAPVNAGGQFAGHRPWGFLAIHTADGLVRGSASNLTGTGTISLGTPTTLTMSTAPGSAAVPGTRISIPGAGPAAATLSTRIVARNDSNNTLTIADAASTAVAGVTVAIEVGQWLGVNAVLMSDTVPASGTWAVGDEVRRGSVTAASPVTGYRCIAAGSPGTWRQCGHIVGKNVTGSRPALVASDVGVCYLDTTLDADGKPIWWTGTAWVDATGTVV